MYSIYILNWETLKWPKASGLLLLHLLGTYSIVRKASQEASQTISLTYILIYKLIYVRCFDDLNSCSSLKLFKNYCI